MNHVFMFVAEVMMVWMYVLVPVFLVSGIGGVKATHRFIGRTIRAIFDTTVKAARITTVLVRRTHATKDAAQEASISENVVHLRDVLQDKEEDKDEAMIQEYFNHQ